MKSARSKNFLTTREVSDLLELSVGTIQKLADNKDLEAYVTTGGHRRISSDSVKRYMGKMEAMHSPAVPRPAQYGLSADDIRNCDFVFLMNDLHSQAQSEQIHFHRAAFVSRPSELFRLFGHRGVIVIDAAVTWVDWIEGVSELAKAQDGDPLEVLVFNASLIPEDRFALIPEGVLLFQDKLTIDFVKGYFALQNRLAGMGHFASMN